MSTRILFLFLSVVPATAAADCGTDANEQANKLFVEAGKFIKQAKKDGNRLSLLKNALQCLEAIIEKYRCSDLAVQLISEQQIGNISMAALEARINMQKQFDEDACSSFCKAILFALNISNDKIRDPILASIARKQVRSGNLEVASDTVDLIVDSKERERLRGYIDRAQVRAAVRASKPHR